MMRHRMIAITAAGLFAAAAVAVTPRARCDEPSLADKASARDLFAEGVALRAKGDHKGALAKFNEAYVLWPSPSTGLELGRAHMQLGELIEARERFLETAKLPPKPTETPAAQGARDEAQGLAAALLPRIPSLVFKVSGAPAGANVRIVLDGRELPSSASRKVNPGRHAVLAKASGLPDVTLEVHLEESETREVPLVFGTAAPAPGPPAATEPVGSPPVSPPPPPGAGRTTDAPRSGGHTGTIGLITLGGGVLVMGVGGVIGLSASSKYHDAKDAHCNGDVCSAEGKQSTDDARGLAAVGTIVFGVGAVVAVGGALLWLTAPRAEATTASGITHVGFGAGTLSLGGRF